ncbi:MAG: hypothetical protein HKN76_17440 [Saprospiraceae bacterium]|nr:hypothetical protein [Saprospiraceae bacterium]
MLRWVAAISIILAFCISIYSWLRFRDRHPGYEVAIEAEVKSGAFEIGFASEPINPEIIDKWVDVNQDARFRPEDGDSFTDINQNGRFDAIWIAGFHNQRAAMGIHDTLWARTLIVQRGDCKIALCVIDAIGFGSDDIIEIRKRIEKQIEIDYVTVSSTHSHQTPDLLGMWGDGDFDRGVNDDYLQLVKERCVKSVLAANANLRPAKLRYAEDLSVAEHLVEDSRKPIVLDPGLRILHFTDARSDQTLGTLIGWANHPETVWSKNMLLSSDFPHYLREAVERGIYQGDSLWIPGLGGTSIFINGAIGGLMTASPRFGIMSLMGDTTFIKPSFDKAKAQGETLAFLALQLLADTSWGVKSEAGLKLMARSVELPMKNHLFKLANWLGVLDRGMTGWFKIRSEICYWSLGNVGFLHVPGEIYPEIVNGGIESPPGQDYPINPVEIPPLRHLLPATHNFVVGLSNDMIGYIIPKSEWDEEKPYLYHDHDSPYGEVNSLGPETAPILHNAIVKILEDWEE